MCTFTNYSGWLRTFLFTVLLVNIFVKEKHMQFTNIHLIESSLFVGRSSSKQQLKTQYIIVEEIGPVITIFKSFASQNYMGLYHILHHRTMVH